MSDFSKGTGPGGEQTNVDFLRRENASLKGLNQMLSQELVARAQPVIGEVTDALNAFAQAANAGNPAAKGALQKFVEAIDGARDAASKLTIIRNGHTP